MRKETESKIEALERKAASTQGELKATLDRRIEQIRRDYDDSQARIKDMLADHLTELAAHLRQ
jgi:hypothetical protein